MYETALTKVSYRSTPAIDRGMRNSQSSPVVPPHYMPPGGNPGNPNEQDVSKGSFIAIKPITGSFAPPGAYLYANPNEPSAIYIANIDPALNPSPPPVLILPGGVQLTPYTPLKTVSAAVDTASVRSQSPDDGPTEVPPPVRSPQPQSPQPQAEPTNPSTAQPLIAKPPVSVHKKTQWTSKDYSTLRGLYMRGTFAENVGPEFRKLRATQMSDRKLTKRFLKLIPRWEHAMSKVRTQPPVAAPIANNVGPISSQTPLPARSSEPNPVVSGLAELIKPAHPKGPVEPKVTVLSSEPEPEAPAIREPTRPLYRNTFVVKLPISAPVQKSPQSTPTTPTSDCPSSPEYFPNSRQATQKRNIQSCRAGNHPVYIGHLEPRPIALSTPDIDSTEPESSTRPRGQPYANTGVLNVSSLLNPSSSHTNGKPAAISRQDTQPVLTVSPEPINSPVEASADGRNSESQHKATYLGRKRGPKPKHTAIKRSQTNALRYDKSARKLASVASANSVVGQFLGPNLKRKCDPPEPTLKLKCYQLMETKTSSLGSVSSSKIHSNSVGSNQPTAQPSINTATSSKPHKFSAEQPQLLTMIDNCLKIKRQENASNLSNEVADQEPSDLMVDQTDALITKVHSEGKRWRESSNMIQQNLNYRVPPARIEDRYSAMRQKLDTDNSLSNNKSQGASLSGVKQILVTNIPKITDKYLDLRKYPAKISTPRQVDPPKPSNQSATNLVDSLPPGEPDPSTASKGANPIHEIIDLCTDPPGEFDDLFVPPVPKPARKQTISTIEPVAKLNRTYLLPSDLITGLPRKLRKISIAEKSQYKQPFLGIDECIFRYERESTTLNEIKTALGDLKCELSIPEIREQFKYLEYRNKIFWNIKKYLGEYQATGELLHCSPKFNPLHVISNRYRPKFVYPIDVSNFLDDKFY